MSSNPLRFLMLPWWILTLASGTKSFVDHPLIGSRRLNEAGLHATRLRIAHSMAWRRRKRLTRLISPTDKADFDRDGFVIKSDFLPAELFRSLRNRLEAWRGPARDMRQGNTITRRFALDPALLSAVPELREVLRNPDWRGLIRYANSFDTEPVTYIQTILANVLEGPDDPQINLHSDAFHPSVKAWLFLEDVAENEGPFTYVPGSHLLTPKRLEWEREKSLVARHAERLTARGSFRVGREELCGLDLPQPKLCAVPANTLVVADTFGFHARGPSVGASRRVEIWAYGRRNPFLPWTGFDLGGIPGIAERRAPAYWRFRDRFERWIGQPWQDAGVKCPFDM